jgi:proteasome alpha subunit
MMSPYDWQEAVNQRGQYVAGRLEAGIPVVMVSVKEGILAVSYSRNARKIYEIYDRLMFGGLGLQSDMEQLRVAAIEFTHREGFERSEDDVSVARVALALSQPMKSSFNDFRSAPIVARGVFAEVADTPEKDEYYVLDFDGDYQQECNAVYIAGKEMPSLQELITQTWGEQGYADALKKIVPILEATVLELYSEIGDLKLEAALLKRGVDRDRRFYRLSASLIESKKG